MTHVPTESEPIIDFKVWNPPKGSSRPQRDLPDSYFEPTANELKAIYHGQVKAREALANAPLKTQQIREQELKSKMERWPTTRIRVKFPDRTQLERTFPSTDKIKSVYAFVRSSLRDDVKPIKFVLYQAPPRREFKVSDPQVRNLTLFELQFAPSSVLQLSFFDDSLNDPDKRAPLLDFMLLQARDLSPPPDFEETTDKDSRKPWRNKSTQVSSGSSSAMPKWFKIGQKK